MTRSPSRQKCSICLHKPSPLNINLGSDRFSMFNKKAGHPLVATLRNAHHLEAMALGLDGDALDRLASKDAV